MIKHVVDNFEFPRMSPNSFLEARHLQDIIVEKPQMKICRLNEKYGYLIHS